MSSVSFSDVLRALIVIANLDDMDDSLADINGIEHIYDAAVIALVTMRISTRPFDLMGLDDGVLTVYLERLQQAVNTNLETNQLNSGVHPDTGRVVKRVLRPRPV